MVNQVDVDCFGGLAQLSGQMEVGRARSGVAAGMIVGANHSGRAFSNRLTEHFPRMGQCGGRGPGAYFHSLQQSIFPIQTKNPEFLDLEPLSDRLEKRTDQIGAV